MLFCKREGAASQTALQRNFCMEAFSAGNQCSAAPVKNQLVVSTLFQLDGARQRARTEPLTFRNPLQPASSIRIF
jgi:hypothetical protein